MTTRKLSIAGAAATVVVLLLSGTAATGVAQTPKPAPGKMASHPEAMKGMPGMNGMMAGPHHVLAMAYRDNLMTFARALQRQVPLSKTVDPELAQPAVAEMRRSFDQMRLHHDGQMKMMADHATPMMSTMTQHMETHLAALGEHLTALEAEVNASVPDPRKVSEHTAEILKHSAAMSSMPAKAKAMAH